ncbi:hypothetical protein FEM48_Zijuj08G0029300 [Ziziphus jujuba var. spinosa]|uniref:Uncharacterized protein n=1 Tax=Ziziphus jujuba var. spinosa TaxID=714518 RepID=A0A978UWK8_ZIZJJ|nr:hypothetical protein FEM48_Zijuj08G0029300 [Ziziphus jujuba var. spinosa]
MGSQGGLEVHGYEASVWQALVVGFLLCRLCLSTGIPDCGIVEASFADTQLHDFVSGSEKLKELGKPLVANLDEGLWHYSRHPNYFEEQPGGGA